LIDNTAIVHPQARLAEDIEIGPYCIIGAEVEVSVGCKIASHVIVNGSTRIGKNNKIHPFCSIGSEPQDKKFQDEKESVLEIGDGNTIWEYCSISRGTALDAGITKVGNDNWIMAYVHIAHDCTVGNNTIFANNTTLAGHVAVEDCAILGGFTGVHQFCKIGKNSLTAISSIIVKDVPPYLIVSGNTAKPSGLNREGLKRYHFSQQTIELIRQAYKIVYRQGLTLNDALDKLAPIAEKSDEVSYFVRFIRDSSRGIVR